MYVQCHIVALSRNSFCHGNATIRSPFICVGLDVAVNNTKVYSVAMKMQECFPFALLSSYNIFRTAANNVKY
jgi:hypothetical protein